MFKRKIQQKLLDWANKSKHHPLIVSGLRQVGKTTSVLEFAKKYKENVVYIDFRSNKNAQLAFDGNFDIDEITTYLTGIIPNAKFIPYKTVIIFDEIQDCQNARSSLKYFEKDGRYEVIATGSLLGVKGYHLNDESRGIPVGFEENIVMKAMDFEEFLWALGKTEELTNYLKECYIKKKAVNPGIFEEINKLYLQYIVVGGMPEVVMDFVNNKNFQSTYQIQKNILFSMEADFGKHLLDDGSFQTNFKEKEVLEMVFRSIPSQLSNENKKFMYSRIEGKISNSEYSKALTWLEDYGLIIKSYNLKRLELPLNSNKIDDQFKIYLADIGLLIAMNEQGTIADILTNNLYIYKGAIFENLFAETFNKSNLDLYYYRKSSSTLEIDFISRRKGKILPIEIKATNGNSKSLKEILTNPIYECDEGIKFYNGNVSKIDKLISLPHFFSVFFKGEYETDD